MTEQKQRRNLVAVFDNTTPAIPRETVAAVAAQNGFNPPQPVPANDGQQQPQRSRRQRQPKGRDFQFNVRLRQDTIDFIYEQANARNIPIAQVIEEATEALKRQR